MKKFHIDHQDVRKIAGVLWYRDSAGAAKSYLASAPASGGTVDIGWPRGHAAVLALPKLRENTAPSRVEHPILSLLRG